jgi:hypothetical protein
MNLLERFLEDDLLGVRFAVNVAIGTTFLWILLRLIADTNPVWAIASMIVAGELGSVDAIQRRLESL